MEWVCQQITQRYYLEVISNNRRHIVSLNEFSYLFLNGIWNDPIRHHGRHFQLWMKGEYHQDQNSSENELERIFFDHKAQFVSSLMDHLGQHPGRNKQYCLVVTELDWNIKKIEHKFLLSNGIILWNFTYSYLGAAQDGP